ncbi:MAG: hypothetical protein H6713_09775 [Myxococcales bacterium]|nr:hypothetical protein [Myxococcales bacterium]
MILTPGRVLAAPGELRSEVGIERREAEDPPEVATEPGVSGAASASASWQDEDPRVVKAREQFFAASELFHAERYADAGEAFLKSFKIMPSIDSLWAAANSFRLADEVVRAVDVYERYFRYVDDNRERAEQSRAHYDQLCERVGRVNVQLAEGVDVREILVNGESVALDAFPHKILAGPVEVVFVGSEPGQREVSRALLQGRSTTVITFAGFVSAEPRDPLEDQPPPVDGSSGPRLGLKAAFWTGVGLTAAGAVTIGALGGLALHYRREWEARLCPDMSCVGVDMPEPAEPWRVRAEDFQGATNIAIGVTAGVATVTFILGAVALSQRARAQDEEDGRARARRTRARVVARGAGLGVAF